jgi:malate:Na+ symporter
VIIAGTFERIPENMIGGLAIITGFGMLLGPLGNRCRSSPRSAAVRCSA